MLKSFTRNERVIIVEDDRIRSVVIGPKQRLRPAFFVSLAFAGMGLAFLGWGWTAAELLATRQTAAYIEQGSKSLATQLAESEAQIAALGDELTRAKGTLSVALAEDEKMREQVAVALSALSAADGKDNAQAVRTLKAAVAEARSGLASLAAGEGNAREGLAATAQSLESVAAVSREMAERRAEVAVAAQELAAVRADAPKDENPQVTAEGLALALAEAQAEAARLRDAVLAAELVRDQALQAKADTKAVMASMSEGQVELLNHIVQQTDLRIGTMEDALEGTGLKLDVILAKLDERQFARGGPLLTLAALPTEIMPPAVNKAMSTLESRMDRQHRLQTLMRLLPLSAPSNDYYISSGYGRRLDPFTNQRAMHTGVDFVAPYRSPVTATAPGKVVFAGYDTGGYGRMVEVDHGFGIRTRYGHLDKVAVGVGDSVELGQQVGLLGNSGRSSGPHIHYEILVNGDPIDPMRFLERGRHVCQG